MYKLLVPLILVTTLAAQPGLANLQRELYGGPSGQTPSGPQRGGFALSLSRGDATAHLGGPIWVTVELRNVSGRTEGAFFGSRNPNYQFAIVNQRTGQQVPRVNSAFGLDASSGPPNGHLIYAGTSLYGKFRLDELYKFTEPGKYSVRVQQGVPIINGQALQLGSNSITIIVLPE